MLTQAQLENILANFTHGLQERFGSHLKGVILYGSYARGDFDAESDVDVLVLLDYPQEVLWTFRRPVNQIANRADWDFNTLISPVIKNDRDFEQLRELPFYRNVHKEGVKLLAA